MSRDKGFPNAAFRIFLLGMEEVLGQEQTKTVVTRAGLERLKHSYPPNTMERELTFGDYARLNQAVIDASGSQAPQVLTRIGRISMQIAMRESPFLAGTDATQHFFSVIGAALKFMPTESRMRVVLHTMATAMGRTARTRINVEEDPEGFLWDVEECPACWGRTSSVPSCWLATGMLQEALQWATGGKEFQVEEITCHAIGHAHCRHRISKQPKG